MPWVDSGNMRIRGEMPHTKMSLLKEIKDGIAAGFAEVKAWMAEQNGNAAVQAKGAEFNTKLQAIEAKVSQLESAGATAQQTISTLQADKTRLEGELQAANNKVTELQNTIKDPKGTIQQVAGQQAAEVLAQTGVTGALPLKPEANAAAANGGAKTDDELRAEMKDASPTRKFEINNELRARAEKRRNGQ